MTTQIKNNNTVKLAKIEWKQFFGEVSILGSTLIAGKNSQTAKKRKIFTLYFTIYTHPERL